MLIGLQSRFVLCRAAFQYGVKMNDGRKTRRQAGANKEKAKLDREWQQISQVFKQLTDLFSNPSLLTLIDSSQEEIRKIGCVSCLIFLPPSAWARG